MSQPTATTPAQPAGTEALAAAARSVVDAVVRAGDHCAERAAELAARLRAIADELDRCAPPLQDRLGEMREFSRSVKYNPVTGPGNPFSPPLDCTDPDDAGDGTVRGAVALGLPYQGPPGHVHGGISALLMDHMMGVANGRAGVPGMTARLTLDYHRPVPLYQELTVTARHRSSDGRKVLTTGTIGAGGETYVSAEGLFIQPRTPLRE
ncbi:PaaI family thioesterase [Amycolatopsis cynarae]|uniref:Acyl-coenzyme A thioesterase THEM4 n=1 Tax=Amycolatopsis cynarae TaxID=2995223 RepID=A0ABY7BAV1_9PSEU|nr:PaaI family thioesterase [Amycolatopsis sp. HUAS 11-8]WAL68263.1 PaaI family thioesterase [Amycolatopsis sp. HUAS 11-8]